MKDLLILHGALGSNKQTLALEPYLKGHFNCHFLNFSGHASQPFEEQFGMKQFVKETKEYILKNELISPLVFGYSMGGYIALMIEHSQAQSFEAIFTLGTKFDWNPESSAKEASMLNPAKLEEKVPTYAKNLEEEHGASWKELCEKTAAMMLALGNEPVLLPEILSQIQCKTRIGLGDRDKMVSVEESIQAYKSTAKASMIMLPNTPHPLDKVNHKYLSAALIDFFLSEQ